jgi:rhodanese-related sulfurtransferase
MSATMNATNTNSGTGATDRLLASARARISTVDANETARLQAAGATLVDTRPAAQRAEFGEIAGAVIIERNVLEWRLDPDGDHRLTTIDHSRPIVVFCQEGYSSSLAVASLVDLGLTDVHDLAGGFAAWSAAGLPVQPPARPSDLPRSNPPVS